MRYIWAAINSRIEGVPANWLFILAAVLLGIWVPWVWLGGLLIEVSFVAALTASPRFRRAVDAQRRMLDHRRPANKDALLAQLRPEDQLRLAAFEKRAREAEQLAAARPGGLAEQTKVALDQISFGYLKLLLANTHSADQPDARRAAAEDLKTLEARLDEARAALARGLPVDLPTNLRLSTGGIAPELEPPPEPEKPRG